MLRPGPPRNCRTSMARAGSRDRDDRSGSSSRPAAPSAAGLAASLLPQRLRGRLPSPSDEGGREEFREFCFTRAARSATSRRSCPTCSRSSPASATCTRSSAISSSRSAISSRSRAFAARSPATVSARAAASPGTRGVSGTRRTPPQPAHRHQDNTPSRPASITGNVRPPGQKETYLVTAQEPP